MNKPARELTEAQKEAIAFLKRPKLNFDDWWKEEIRKIEAEAEAKAMAALKVGDTWLDGTIFAGTTAEGKQIFTTPKDLDKITPFNKAVKGVKKLNIKTAYGHKDWVIPKKEVLNTLCQNRDKGALAGTFKTVSGNNPFHPNWYWSSSESPHNPAHVYATRSTGGYDYLNPKGDNYLSCRPVRLVLAPTI